MASRTNPRERYSFANLDEDLSKLKEVVIDPVSGRVLSSKDFVAPDFIDIQRKSFEDFLKVGLAEAFKDISPITDFHGNLRLELEYDPDDEDLFTEPKYSVEE